MTITHDALDLNIQGPPFPVRDMGSHCTGPLPLLVMSGCHHLRTVQTCSLQKPLLMLTSGIYLSMVRVLLECVHV